MALLGIVHHPSFAGTLLLLRPVTELLVATISPPGQSRCSSRGLCKQTKRNIFITGGMVTERWRRKQNRLFLIFVFSQWNFNENIFLCQEIPQFYSCLPSTSYSLPLDEIISESSPAESGCNQPLLNLQMTQLCNKTRSTLCIQWNHSHPPTRSSEYCYEF